MKSLFLLENTTPMDALSIGSYSYDILVSSTHPIFEGHFPGQPILPGVAMVYALRQALSEAIGELVEFQEIKICKFLQAINPEISTHLQLRFQINSDTLTAEMDWNGTICFKFKGLFHSYLQS